MRHLWLSLLCAFIILNACSTTDRAQKIYPANGRSSADPLRILYDIRLNQFEKANLVLNPLI